jgi:hypothetical protein
MSHDDHHDGASSLTFHEKTVKMLEHWIKHNHEHAQNYNKWANEIKNNIDENVSVFLKDAADLTLSINKKFEEAVNLLEEMKK